MAGRSSDHTEAATITPAAKPSSNFCTRWAVFSRIKSTTAEPIIVPRAGKTSNGKICFIIKFSIFCVANIRPFGKKRPFSFLLFYLFSYICPK